MNRTKLNYLLDLIITIIFIIVAFTGFFMHIAIPEGIPRGRYQEYMGITKALWTIIHTRSSMLLSIGIGIHIILHKNWISCVTASLLKRKNEEHLCKIDERIDEN